LRALNGRARLAAVQGLLLLWNNVLLLCAEGIVFIERGCCVNAVLLLDKVLHALLVEQCYLGVFCCTLQFFELGKITLNCQLFYLQILARVIFCDKKYYSFATQEKSPHALILTKSYLLFEGFAVNNEQFLVH